MAKKISEIEGLKTWLTGAGILFMLMGLVAIILPTAASVAVTMLFGALMLLLGIIWIAVSFKAQNWAGFLLFLLCGLLLLGGALFTLFQPFAGMIALTLVMIVMFLVQGIFKLLLDQHTGEVHGWMMFDGAVCILLGLMVFIGWPADSIWVLGLLFGINLLFSGLTFLLLAGAATKK